MLDRYTDSWLWGNLNYPETIDIINELYRKDVRIVLICSNLISTRQAHGQGRMPPWASAVLTVPFVGVEWFVNNLDRIISEAIALAKSVNDHVFIVSAGPIANALIPVLSSAVAY